MFDNSVVEEGLGQASVAERRVSLRGGSPDGLGAYATPDYGFQQSVQPPPPRPVYEPEQEAVGGEIDWIEPDDTSSGAATKSAGFTLLFVAVMTGVGYAIKGGLGAASGLLLGAGIANGYRAQKWWDSGEPSEKHEAIVSAVFGVGEVAAGAYVGYKAFKAVEKK